MEDLTGMSIYRFFKHYMKKQVIAISDITFYDLNRIMLVNRCRQFVFVQTITDIVENDKNQEYELIRPQ